MSGSGMSRPTLVSEAGLTECTDYNSARIHALRGQTCLFRDDQPFFGTIETRMESSAYETAKRLIDAPLSSIVRTAPALFFQEHTFGLVHGLVSSDAECPIAGESFWDLVMLSAKGKLLSRRRPGDPLFPPEPYPYVDCIVHVTCGNAFWPASLLRWLQTGAKNCPICRGNLYRM